MEDNEQVLKITRKMIKTIGYAVIAPKNIHEAIDHCGDRNRPTDLILTDAVMHGMSGREMKDRI